MKILYVVIIIILSFTSVFPWFSCEDSNAFLTVGFEGKGSEKYKLSVCNTEHEIKMGDIIYIKEECEGEMKLLDKDNEVLIQDIYLNGSFQSVIILSKTGKTYLYSIVTNFTY